MDKNFVQGLQAPVWMIWILSIIEYCIVLGDEMYITLGYIFLTYLLVCNYNGKRVLLPYEQMLSIWLKFVCVDILMLLFIRGYSEIWQIKDMSVLLAVQIVTVLILDEIMRMRATRRIRKGGLQYTCIHFDEMPKHKEEYHMIHFQGMDGMEQVIAESDAIFLYDIPAEYRNDLMKYCMKYNKVVKMTAKITDVTVRASILAEEDDMPVFLWERYNISRKSAMEKRAFDVVLSAVALVILSPLFLLVCILIKLEDGGDIFYKQTRCTQDMKEFDIIKFRSMIPEAESAGAPKLAEAGDDRLTRIGGFLRKSKIDELPQLINILRGDMSFVGPRPERPELIRQTVERVPEFILRTRVKAGLTGYAQVHGFYDTDFLDKLKWDLMYIENYSPLLDAKIMMMTIPAIIRGLKKLKGR